MDVRDITAENVAKAVGGTIERDGSILCCCPIHEASGTHNPSLLLSITDARRILFHCRSQNCDAKHFHTIRDHLVEKCGLPRSHVGGTKDVNKEIRYNYQHLDGSYSWTKTRYVTKAGKKRFRCEVWDETTKQWSSGRPEDAPLLFNLAAIASVLATYEDMRFSAAMAHTMERAGIGFDIAAHQAWIARKQEPVAAIEAYLAACDPALSPACIASGVQLDQLFRQRLESYAAKDRRPALLGWPKTEKTRRLSFSREDLAAVLIADRLQPQERRLVEALYARAEQVRCLATFGMTFSSNVIDGRLHGQLHAGGAVTGRYTSTDPSLQNIPTDSEFRGFFRAPDGRVLVDVDYSQLELRVFAALSGDAKMIAAFEDGWDYHDLVMQRLGCTRRQAKAVNFGIIFGMGAATLAADLGVDEVTAGEYLRGWDEQAPTGAEWRSSLFRLYVAEQGVHTARRWIDYLDDDDADVSANTRPKNYPVQGGAADVMHRAMRLLFGRYRDWPGDVLPVLTVHDEVLVEADIAVAEQVGSLLADVMVEAFRDVLPNGPTRFLAIAGVGPTWAAAKADGEMREKALRTARCARLPA
jgi:hypothetical protein